MRVLRLLRAVLAAALLAVVLACAVGANSAEPPNLIVLVTLAPDDLQLQLEFPATPTRMGSRRSMNRIWKPGPGSAATAFSPAGAACPRRPWNTPSCG